MSHFSRGDYLWAQRTKEMRLNGRNVGRSGTVVALVGTCAVASVIASASVRASVPSPGGMGLRPAAATASAADCWKVREAERGFKLAMNEDRAQAGKSRLKLDPELSKVARKHTREMVDRTLLHHTTTSALSHRVTRWALLGENVGVGNTVATLHTAFMASPAHRANIMLDSFRYVGVGASVAGDRLWVTVVFENQLDPGTRLRMPRC